MSLHTDKAIIVFVRAPEPGKVKTRLAADIGEANALTVYRHLLMHTRSVLLQCEASLHIFFAEGIPAKDEYWSDTRFSKHVQVGNNLGERIAQAFYEVFLQSYNKVIIVGSDCPELQAKHIAQAFEALAAYDVVIGPAADGGYYLIGMKAVYRSLFEKISWSSSIVLEQTMQAAAMLGLSVFSLPMLNDVDTQDDLPAAYTRLLKTD